MLTRVDLPNGYSRVRNVVITGMGGSGIGGDLIAALLGPRVEVPLIVNKGYDVPAFVDNHTLMLVLSYSGNTEETIAACSAGLTHGAKVVIITTDGSLERMAIDGGLPLVRVPRGMQARAAIAYLFFPLLAILKAAELIDGIEGEGELVALLEERRDKYKPEVELEHNRAKQLAAVLHGSLPIIYGSDDLSGVAALRWKCQLNENAKTIAHHNVFPELNHNEVVGFSNPPGLLKMVQLVLLRDRQDHPQVLRRMEVTSGLIASGIGGVTNVWADGDSELARVFSLIYLGDHVSLYVALLNGVDPAANELSDLIKQRLGEGG